MCGPIRLHGEGGVRTGSTGEVPLTKAVPEDGSAAGAGGGRTVSLPHGRLQLQYTRMALAHCLERDICHVPRYQRERRHSTVLPVLSVVLRRLPRGPLL